MEHPEAPGKHRDHRGAHRDILGDVNTRSHFAMSAPKGSALPWPFGYRPVPAGRIDSARRVRQSRSRETRGRLIWAAEDVIREKGLARATVRAIAARAGVAVGTIYRRLANKDALIRAVGDRAFDRTLFRVSGLRTERWLGASSEDVIRRRASNALLEIERDRHLILAFMEDGRSERAIHAALTALLRRIAPAVSGIDATIDLALLTLRAWTLRAALPSGSRPSRDDLTLRITRLVTQSLGL